MDKAAKREVTVFVPGLGGAAEVVERLDIEYIS